MNLRQIRITPERAKALVQKKFPDYVVEDVCVSYKKSFIVIAHPDDGPEDAEHGAYPDPYYAVNRLTGSVRHFLPVAESDMGKAFSDILYSEAAKLSGGHHE